MEPELTVYLCNGCNQTCALDYLDDKRCPYCGSGELELLSEPNAPVDWECLPGTIWVPEGGGLWSN